MSRPPVPFAPDTLESIRRAFRLAADRRHDLVSLEHMLFALLEDAQARDILTRCRVNIPELRSDLEEVLEQGVHAGARPQGRQARVHARLRSRRRARRRPRRLVERAAGGERSAAGLPAAGGRQPCRVLPAQARRGSAHAAARDLARGADRIDRAGRAGRQRAGSARSARSLCDRSDRQGRQGRHRSAHRPAARNRSDGPGAVPAAEEQPAAGGRAGRRQDGAGRRASRCASTAAKCRRRCSRFACSRWTWDRSSPARAIEATSKSA